MPIEAAVTLAYEYQLMGAGFGMQLPHRFEALFNSTHERKNPEDWQTAFQLGIVDTAEQRDESLEVWERGALELLTEFCKESYPQLIQPLGLAG